MRAPRLALLVVLAPTPAKAKSAHSVASNDPARAVGVDFASRYYKRACPRQSVTTCWQRPETPWPYGMTAEMDELADAPASIESRTAILAGFLTASPNTHMAGSSFRASRDKPQETLAKYVQLLLIRSPGLCVPNVTLHIVHDLNSSSEEMTLLAGTAETRDDLLKVRWHRFAPNARFLGNDRRWELFERVLRSTPWDCAYGIDLSDVMVLRVPPCAHLPPKLLAASDGAVKAWLQAVTVTTRWNNSIGSNYSRMLQYSQQIISCGIVGGQRSIFEPALHTVISRMRERARRIETGEEMVFIPNTTTENKQNPNILYRPGTDMILWNDMAFKIPTLTGYPSGPVSLPPWSTPHIARGVACGSHDCRHQFVNVTRRQYWFGHKIIDSWIKDYVAFYRECPSVESDGRELGTGAAASPEVASAGVAIRRASGLRRLL